MDFCAAACDNGGMTEHKTFPGKVYTVSCAEDTTVVLPDPLGVKEAVVLECTAGQQLHVTATAGRLETSSDQAIVTELFKLAPRLKLTLLQGVAGGWLPKGYVELEYLQSSGSQYIDTGIATDGKYTISCRLQVASTGAVWGRACTPPHAEYTGGQSWARFLSPNDSNKGLWFYYNYVGSAFSNNASKPPMWDISKPHDWVAVEGGKTVMLDGESVTLGNQFNYTVIVTNPDKRTHYIFATNGEYIYGTGKASMKLYRFTMIDGRGNTVFDGVPVLNADGEAGILDRVSKRFLSNDGDGTFGWQLKNVPAAAAYTLRGRSKPGYMPPSGIWARPAGVNGLEVVADTEEVDGEDWLHFANTAAAYEHFGVVQEEILTE